MSSDIKIFLIQKNTSLSESGIDQASLETIKDGFSPIGWEDSNGEVFTTLQEIFLKIQKTNCVYTAIWPKIIYFNANQGKFPDGSTRKGLNITNEGIVIPTDFSSPEREGYSFRGWGVDIDQIIANFSGSSDNNNIPVSDLKEKIDFIALWHKNEATYTISFDPRGGSVNPNTVNTDTNGQLTSLPIPRRTNYAFDSWYYQLPFNNRELKVNTNTYFVNEGTIFANWTWKPGIPDDAPIITINLTDMIAEGSGFGYYEVYYNPMPNDTNFKTISYYWEDRIMVDSGDDKYPIHHLTLNLYQLESTTGFNISNLLPIINSARIYFVDNWGDEIDYERSMKVFSDDCEIEILIDDTFPHIFALEDIMIRTVEEEELENQHKVYITFREGDYIFEDLYEEGRIAISFENTTGDELVMGSLQADEPIPLIDIHGSEEIKARWYQYNGNTLENLITVIDSVHGTFIYACEGEEEYFYSSENLNINFKECPHDFL